jgi:hypothetical protein
MIIDMNFHSGLLFGIEADPVYDMDENGQLSGEKTPAISVYLGFLSFTIIFANPQQQ